MTHVQFANPARGRVRAKTVSHTRKPSFLPPDDLSEYAQKLHGSLEKFVKKGGGIEAECLPIPGGWRLKFGLVGAQTPVLQFAKEAKGLWTTFTDSRGDRLGEKYSMRFLQGMAGNRLYLLLDFTPKY